MSGARSMYTHRTAQPRDHVLLSTLPQNIRFSTSSVADDRRRLLFGVRLAPPVIAGLTRRIWPGVGCLRGRHLVETAAFAWQLLGDRLVGAPAVEALGEALGLLALPGGHELPGTIWLGHPQVLDIHLHWDTGIQNHPRKTQEHIQGGTAPAVSTRHRCR